MSTMSKLARPRVGDRCWFVEWCVKDGANEYGDHDPDKDEKETRRVSTREEAEALACSVYPQDVRGFVEFWPAEFVAYDEDDALAYPHVGLWETTADAETYEGA
jgi:hypothetical protein